jgi:hypothetical protein
VSHPGDLEQEAPEEEEADDEGERDENDFNETHSSVPPKVARARLIQGRHSIGASSGVSTYEPCVLERLGLSFSC